SPSIPIGLLNTVVHVPVSDLRWPCPNAVPITRAATSPAGSSSAAARLLLMNPIPFPSCPLASAYPDAAGTVRNRGNLEVGGGGRAEWVRPPVERSSGRDGRVPCARDYRRVRIRRAGCVLRPDGEAEVDRDCDHDQHADDCDDDRELGEGEALLAAV